MTMTDSACKSHHPKGNQREPLTFSKNKSDIQRMIFSWVGLGHPQSSKSATRPICSPHIFHFQPPHVSFSDWWGLGPPPSSKSYTMFFCGGSKSATRPICSWLGVPTPPSSQVIQKLRWIVRGFPLGAANHFSGGCKSATRPIWSTHIKYLMGAANRRRGPFAAVIIIFYFLHCIALSFFDNEDVLNPQHTHFDPERLKSLAWLQLNLIE